MLFTYQAYPITNIQGPDAIPKFAHYWQPKIGQIPEIEPEIYDELQMSITMNSK
jgi:hypothetical protein